MVLEVAIRPKTGLSPPVVSSAYFLTSAAFAPAGRGPRRRRSAGSSVAAAPRRQDNANQNQGDARDVVRVQALAQEDPRQYHAENRHQVHEQSGHLGADRLHAAVPEDVRQYRREHGDAQQRRERGRRPGCRAPQRHLREPERKDAQVADDCDREQEGQRVYAGGRRRSSTVYSDHITIARMTKMSPRLSLNEASASSDPPDRIASTPQSETATPASCIRVSRSPKNSRAIAMIITGMNELSSTPFVALV